jgi:hypothetical protein
VVPSVLWVDSRVHAGEVARFRSYVVAGPDEDSCSLWRGAIGTDSYGRFYITRDGVGRCVRPNRYALALATGMALTPDVFALHECDVPLCVKVAEPRARCQHVVAGTQRDNMLRMARAGRGGGRPTIRRDGRGSRRARSVALRAAVHEGWDTAAVAAALLGSDEPTLW